MALLGDLVHDGSKLGSEDELIDVEKAEVGGTRLVNLEIKEEST